MLDEDFWELRLGDTEYLKEIIKVIKEDNKIADPIETFFFYALGPYYCPVGWDGIKRNAGHIIYRLSDFLPEEKRSNIAIYPSEHGSLIVNNYPWDSLGDWRKKWEKHYPNGIPEMIKKLPHAFSFLEDKTK